MVHEVHGSGRVSVLRPVSVGVGSLGAQIQHKQRVFENATRLDDSRVCAFRHFHPAGLLHDERVSDHLRRVLFVLYFYGFLHDHPHAEDGGSGRDVRCLYNKMVKMMPGFDNYRHNTMRKIPVIELKFVK